MEFDELSNRATKNCAQDCWNRPMSSAIDLFVSFGGEMSPLHNSVLLREAQAFSLARSLHSLKTPRYRDTKIAKNSLSHE